MNDTSYEKFFIALQRINEVAADADSTDDLISAVLNEMLGIFQCDRAWLLYPCDPDTPSWQVVMERTRPEWPGGLEMNVEFPTKPDDVAIFRALLDSGQVLKYDANKSLESEFSAQFSIKAQLIMAIRPKMDKAWVFGIHHCAHPRVYTKAEEYLFEIVGKRVAEALNHFLAMRQLCESERYNRMLFENSPVGLILCLQKSGLLVEANQAFAEMLGRNIEEIKGFIFGQELPGGVSQQGWWADEYLGKIGKLSFRVEELIHKEGYRVPMQISSNLIEKDGECYILSSVENVTERKRAMDALRQSERELREAQRIASVGSWRLDLATNHVVWSEEIYRMLGLNPELPPPDYTEHGRLFTPESWERLRTALSRTLETGVPYELELEMAMLDGSHGWMLARGEALRDASGAIVALQGVAVDITGRKQADEALRVAAAAFETQDAIVIADADGTIIRVNRAFSAITGYSPEEVLGKSMGMMEPEQDGHDFCTERLQQSIHDGSWAGEIYDQRKNGQIYPKWMTMTAVKNERQEITHYVSIFSDITARKQVGEAKLRESEERFRGTLEQAAVGIAHATLEGHFQQVNQKFCNIVGYPRDELLNMSFQDITFPDDLDENIRCRQQLFAGEIATFSLEKRYMRKDRSLIWVNLTVSMLRDADGIPKYTIGVIEDITERKQAEALEQQFGGLLQNSFDEIYVFDAQSLHFLLTSEGAEKNLGYSSDELNRLTLLDLCPSFIEESCAQKIASLSSGEQQSLHFEAVFRRKNGTIYPVEVRLQFMASDFPVFMAVVQDITERKCSEHRLRDLSAHLQTVREEEKASVAREIHDNLGSTLTALKMDVYWLADELSANKDAALLIEHVESMSQLLDNAVDVTRRVITDLRPTILDDLGLQAALEWQAGQFHKRTGIQCLVTTCACIECRQDELDKTQTINLFRIFQESLTNVARHSGASRVEVELQCEDGEVILAISDNGCGLPEGHTIAQASYGMLGMRERAEQLGGRVNFYSPPGGGFSVTVILPLLTDNQKEGEIWP